MHPILSDRRRFRAFLVLWVPLGLFASVLPFLRAGGRWDDAWAVAVWGEAFALPALSSWYVCRFSPVNAQAWQVLTTVMASALLTAGLWLGAGWLWFWALAFTPLGQEPLAVFPRLAPLAFACAAVAFVVMSAVHFAINASDEGRVAVQRALEADVATREAELRALRSQVNPHFLFNCLHSISAFVGRDPEGARRMCLELADFFRDSLRAGSEARISIEAETALVRRYLDIERVRFGDRLRSSISVSHDAEGMAIPPLLLQPLAENAVRHGIATLIDGGDIAIDISRQGTRVQISVENPFDADGRRPGAGVGLVNVRQRLEATFGSRADLRVEASGSRFRASISLPAEEVVSTGSGQAA